eukprot:GHVR01133236.1.p1 GENE.GHVR01133236.1~~GHVR01133236.1.p1  ORF type:complete len:158 (+),score=39.12 GHVR01133236.1:155-628(+)
MDIIEASMLEARKKLAQRAGDNTRTGGKGTARRKKRVVHKTQATDEKKLQSTLKRLNVNTISNCEEVNMFKDNGVLMQFMNPKVQANINANVYVITGISENKSYNGMQGDGHMYASGNNIQASDINQVVNSFNNKNNNNDDDDVPDLVDNFEEVSKN